MLIDDHPKPNTSAGRLQDLRSYIGGDFGVSHAMGSDDVASLGLVKHINNYLIMASRVRKRPARRPLARIRSTRNSCSNRLYRKAITEVITVVIPKMMLKMFWAMNSLTILV